jgi:murein DD-endopeptidase MepM/ murein hydrolase activator NlpD
MSADVGDKYRGSYTVRQGDSIYGISRTYGVPVAELQQANGITDARGIKAGAVLRVPGGGDAPLQQVAVAPPSQTQYSSPPSQTQYSAPLPSPSMGNAPSSAQQPTVLNGQGSSSQYTQVATRNTNDVAAGGAAQPPRQSVSGSDKLR